MNLAGAATAGNLSSSDTKALYGELKWEVSAPLTATLNARYDNIDTSYESYIPLSASQIAAGKKATGQKTFNVWSERVGVNYALSAEREIYSNISTGFRVPTISQLYGSTISPTGSVLANPDLAPEKSLNKEIGLRSKSEMLGIALDMDVALFQIDREDFILNTGGQYQTTPSAEGVEQYQNIGGRVQPLADRVCRNIVCAEYLPEVIAHRRLRHCSSAGHGKGEPAVPVPAV